MGLLRLGVVAAVGIALLPSDSEQQEILYNRAALAAQWTVTFCDRNEATCAQASWLWEQFAKKAEFAGRMAYDTLSEQLAANTGTTETGSIATAADAPSRSLERGTLTPSDLEPKWRGSDRTRAPKPAGRLDKGNI